MNADPNNQPADSQISAVLAKELADVEASVEPRISQQLVSSCFRFLRRLVVVAVVVYLLMFACLALFENRILYQGAEYSADIWKPDQQGFTEVEFETADGIKLFGWYFPLQGEGDGSEDAGSMRPRTILHCHGNAENIAQVGVFTSKQFSHVLQANVFSFDYRGFGKSEGSPHEAGLQKDADAALAWVCERDQVKPSDVIIVGHSLGGALACYLAGKHGCKALILQRTFSSLSDAASRKYWMFPVRLVMQNEMNSAEAIKRCDVPLFQSHGDADTLVPIDLGRKLFDKFPSANKKFFEVSGMDHLDPLPEHYWTELETFFEQIDSRKPIQE